jgi:copper oxidase (laccase) domain-containing protein
VVDQTRAAFGGAEALLPRVNGGHHLDLWAANARALREAGVDRIELAGVCTACHSGDFFSHRASGGKTGRFAALIGLRA